MVVCKMGSSHSSFVERLPSFIPSTVEPLIKDPPRKGHPPYKGCSSGPIHSSFNLLEEDNLSTEDKAAHPKVSFIWR